MPFHNFPEPIEAQSLVVHWMVCVSHWEDRELTTGMLRHTSTLVYSIYYWPSTRKSHFET